MRRSLDGTFPLVGSANENNILGFETLTFSIGEGEHSAAHGSLPAFG